MKVISLTQGKFAKIDDCDYEALSKYNWIAHKEGNNWYAIRFLQINYKKFSIRMHREIMGISDPSILIDHKDGDGLNNKRNNLRVCNRKQNQQNVRSHKDSNSKYLGVSYRPNRKTYRARIFNNGKEVSLGHYKSEKEAALAYNKAALLYRGEFANLNNI